MRFLLAQLQIDSLARKHNCRDVGEALKKLPKQLNETYDEAMRRIRGQDPEDCELAEQVLSWILYAFRPLTLVEVQHALAVKPSDRDFNREAILDEESLTSVCAGLVIIEQESRINRLVHYATQVYLEDNLLTYFPDAQRNIAIACLTYISFDVFADSCGSSGEGWRRFYEYTLLKYVSKYWAYHIRGNTKRSH